MTQTEARNKYIRTCADCRDSSRRRECLSLFDKLIANADEVYLYEGCLYTVHDSIYEEYPSGKRLFGFTDFRPAQDNGERVVPDGSSTTKDDFITLEEIALDVHPEYFDLLGRRPPEFTDPYETLGRIYRILSYAVRPTGANSTELQNAKFWPLKMTLEMYEKALKLHRLTPEKKQSLSALFDTMSRDDLAEMKELEAHQVIPLPRQRSFITGWSIPFSG